MVDAKEKKMMCCFPCFPKKKHPSPKPTLEKIPSVFGLITPPVDIIDEDDDDDELETKSETLNENPISLESEFKKTQPESKEIVPQYKSVNTYVLHISLPPGSYSTGRKNMLLKIPHSSMPCYCKYFFLTKMEPWQADIEDVVFSIIFQGNCRQHIHRLKIKLFSDRVRKSMIMKISYSEVEACYLNYLNKQTYFDNKKPVVNVMGSCKILPTPSSDPVWLLLMDQGPLDLFYHVTIQRKKYPLTIAEVAKIMFDIILTVCKIHDHHLAHLDLSTENVLYDPKTCRTKLIDFECSQYLDPKQEFHFNINKDKNPTNCENEPTKGLEYYKMLLAKGYASNFGKNDCMSMEQRKGRPANGFQIDVYTLGVIMFELYFVEPPFKSVSGERCKLFFTPSGLNTFAKKFHPSKYLEFNQNPAFEDLIFTCCHLDLKKRPRHARLLLAHPFFRSVPRTRLEQDYIENKNEKYTQVYQADATDFP